MPDDFEYDANGQPYFHSYGFPDRGGWVKAPRDLLRDGRTCSDSKVLYLLMVDESQRLQEDVIAYSYDRIRVEVGVESHHTIKKRVDELEAAGFIEIYGDEPGPKAHTYRAYRVTPPDEAEYHPGVTNIYAAMSRPRRRDQVPQTNPTPQRRAAPIKYDANGHPYFHTYGFPAKGGWVKTPRDLLRDGRLSSDAKVLYLLMVDESQRLQQHEIAYSYARTMAETGIGSHHTIKKRLNELEAAGYVEVDGDEPGTTAHTYRTYRITPLNEAEYFPRVTKIAAGMSRSRPHEEMPQANTTTPLRTAASVVHDTRSTGAGNAASSGTHCHDDRQEMHSKKEDTDTTKEDTQTVEVTAEELDSVELDAVRADGPVPGEAVKGRSFDPGVFLDEMRGSLGDEAMQEHLRDEDDKQS